MLMVGLANQQLWKLAIQMLMWLILMMLSISQQRPMREMPGSEIPKHLSSEPRLRRREHPHHHHLLPIQSNRPRLSLSSSCHVHPRLCLNSMTMMTLCEALLKISTVSATTTTECPIFWFHSTASSEPDAATYTRSSSTWDEWSSPHRVGVESNDTLRQWGSRRSGVIWAVVVAQQTQDDDESNDDRPMIGRTVDERESLVPKHRDYRPRPEEPKKRG